MDQTEKRRIIEALILGSAEPISAARLAEIIPYLKPAKAKELVAELNAEYIAQNRSFEICEVAGGYRVRTLAEFAPYLKQTQKTRPLRLSQAALETLAIVAYRQPVTRGKIEDIRGVAVSTNIVRTLLERNWVRVVGHRDVPGKPALFGTTREFLDYFDLKKLDDLPPLSELKDFDRLNIQLDLPDGEVGDVPLESDKVELGDIDVDNVASIEEARAAAASQPVSPDLEAPDEGSPDESSPLATILPLKQT